MTPFDFAMIFVAAASLILNGFQFAAKRGVDDDNRELNARIEQFEYVPEIDIQVGYNGSGNDGVADVGVTTSGGPQAIILDVAVYARRGSERFSCPTNINVLPPAQPHKFSFPLPFSTTPSTVSPYEDCEFFVEYTHRVVGHRMRRTRQGRHGPVSAPVRIG